MWHENCNGRTFMLLKMKSQEKYESWRNENSKWKMRLFFGTMKNEIISIKNWK